MTALRPTFRSRFETLMRALYPESRPVCEVEESLARWIVDDSEIWGTVGPYDRLTRLVLLAHRLRLAVTFTSRRGEPGFRVHVDSRWDVPSDPTEHHPGLKDLASTCYSMAGRTDPLSTASGLLRDARPILAEAGMGYEAGENLSLEHLQTNIDEFLATWGAP